MLVHGLPFFDRFVQVVVRLFRGCKVLVGSLVRACVRACVHFLVGGISLGDALTERSVAAVVSALACSSLLNSNGGGALT